MPTSTRTVYLTDENGNPLIDEQRNLRTLSFSLMQGYSYRLVERASIVSATYAQVVGYSTATGQTIAGVENASEFDVGDFGIVQYVISDRNNTIGYVTCEVTAVGTDSLTVNGIGISVSGADGKDGAPGADGKDGAATVQIGTVTTGAAGSQASVTNVGADNAAILNFTIPRGDTGAQGVPGPTGAPGADGQDGATFMPSVDTDGNLSWTNDGNLPNPGTVNLRGAQGEAATVQVGQVTTGAAGSEAVVTNVGTANAAILNFTIPRGAQGERGIQGEPGTAGKDGTNGQDGADGAAATVTVGQVTTLPAGSQATVTNSGNENSAVLNFGIPQGATGQAGANGQDGQDGVGIQNIAADGQDENGGNIYRITLTNGQSYTFVAPKGAQGAQGATGATGATGKDFRIYKTYASVAAMNADAAIVPDGEFVMIASTENDPDNAKLYVRTTDGEADFTFISDLSGAQGIQGEAATIAIGQVLTGEPGTNASVENVGTTNAAILNIIIPRGIPGTAGTNGQDGAPGKDGTDGKAATIQIGEVITGEPGTNASVENTGTANAAILKITIPRGNAGVQGEQGEPGQKGADGKDGADGAPGAAATIQIGTVTTGAAGSQATVTNTGTENAAILNFTIPRGNTGAQGNPGNDGVPGADGASGVTDVTAGSPTEQNGYTVTPVTFNFEQGNSKTVNIQAKNGEGAGAQQNTIINRTASVTTADENSPDFVENNGDLWVKKITGYVAEVNTIEATLPTGRGYTSAATAPNGKIYVFGAYGDDLLDDIVEFDPVTQSVTTLEATLPSKIHSTSAATAPNGKIYVFGGQSSSNIGFYLDDIVVFDPVAQTVTTLRASLPSGRCDTSAATAPNGKIYVFGGSFETNRYLDDIVEFDPVAQTVTTLFRVSLPSGRCNTSAATAPNGKIYVFGGQSNSGSFNDIVEFDPVAQTATKLSVTLPSGRYSASAATAPNGKIYVFGGFGTGYIYFDDIVEFDPVAQTVTTLSVTLPSGRHSTSAATAPNGKIYVFGGSYVGNYLDDILEFILPIAQYAYSQAVVLSQEEYTQFKNILKGVFSVGISAPSAEVSGTLSAGNTTVNGTLSASGAVTVDGTVTAPSFDATT